jgi:uncharacterized phage protein (TIGR01671 family)
MREFTFRAWLNPEKKMYIGFDWDSCDYDGWVEFNDGQLMSRIDLRNNCEIMQFTGLKDKNGRDIFEGDIVRYEHSNPTGWQEYIRVVTWNEKAAAFEVPTAGIFTRNIEVIGNIYENPELVE